MKKLLNYDCETSGLVKFGLPSTDLSQPRIISLAADLHDEAGRTFGAMNLLIKPNGWIVPPEITELTGISTEMCEAYGVPIDYALAIFHQLWEQCDQRIGHNESFDMRMIRIELMRDPVFSRANRMVDGEAQTFADYWKAGASFCTQGASTKIVNAARPDGEKKKTANLAEAYKHFTGKELENAHSAWADVQAAKAVYIAIQQLNTGAAA